MPEAPAQPLHPKYSEMITAAIKTLKNRNGSSRQAIVKYIKANYTVLDNCEACVRRALNKNTDGLWVNTKGIGALGSFKINPEKVVKKPAKTKTVKAATQNKTVRFEDKTAKTTQESKTKKESTKKEAVVKKNDSKVKKSKNTKSTTAKGATSPKKQKVKTTNAKSTKESKTSTTAANTTMKKTAKAPTKKPKTTTKS